MFWTYRRDEIRSYRHRIQHLCSCILTDNSMSQDFHTGSSNRLRRAARNFNASRYQSFSGINDPPCFKQPFVQIDDLGKKIWQPDCPSDYIGVGNWCHMLVLNDQRPLWRSQRYFFPWLFTRAKCISSLSYSSTRNKFFTNQWLMP